MEDSELKSNLQLGRLERNNPRNSLRLSKFPCAVNFVHGRSRRTWRRACAFTGTVARKTPRQGAQNENNDPCRRHLVSQLCKWTVTKTTASDSTTALIRREFTDHWSVTKRTKEKLFTASYRGSCIGGSLARRSSWNPSCASVNTPIGVFCWQDLLNCHWLQRKSEMPGMPSRCKQNKQKQNTLQHQTNKQTN